MNRISNLIKLLGSNAKRGTFALDSLDYPCDDCFESGDTTRLRMLRYVSLTALAG